VTAALVVAGLGLLALAVVDIIWTSLAAGSGAGPLTGRMARLLWRTALRVDRRTQVELLTPAGLLIVLSVLAAWILMIFAGWLLVFSASEGAVRNATTGAAGNLIDRAYFTGYTVFTLGLGDYVPGDGVWQLATTAATGSGLLLITLSITYLVPVASAVVLRRQFAGLIASLGPTAEPLVVRGWDGTKFRSLDQNLSALLPLLHTLRLQHYTYPVLHYFHSRSKQDSAAISLVHLDAALRMLRHGVAADVRPDAQTLDALEHALGAFLDAMDGIHISDDPEPVPAPSLVSLVDAGIPVDPAAYDHAVRESETRRRLLASFLHDDGWTVDDLQR
jgi:hypothetical protein